MRHFSNLFPVVIGLLADTLDRLGTGEGFHEYVPLGFSLASCRLGTEVGFHKFVPRGY